MRTFNHIEIHNRIQENPYLYIGQRNFHLFECFMMHINGQTEVKLNAGMAEEFKQMPSIRDYISSKLNVDISQSTRWTWAIGFEVENQNELLETYFNWIDKYENEYPVNSIDYNFECKLNPDFDIAGIIKHMCMRPHMYGINDLSGLRAILDGYYYLKNLYQIDFTLNEIELKNFIDFWKGRVNKDLAFETWDRALIKERMGINPFTFNGGSNGGWVFNRFLQIIEGETKIKLKEMIKDS